MDPGIETNKLIPHRPIVLDPIDRLFESRLKTDTEQRLSWEDGLRAAVTNARAPPCETP